MEAVARRSPLAALVVVAALAVAGCGDDEETDTAAQDTAGNGAAEQAAGGGTVEIGAIEYAFEPSDPTVEEDGPVALELTNDGEIAHALEIEELEESTDTIDAGESTTLETDLDAGEYTIYCPIANHREQGMEGTLAVGGGSESGSDGDSGGSGGGY